MSKFTRPQLREIRSDMETALRKVAEQHGIKFDIGTIRFLEDSFKVSLKAESLDRIKPVVLNVDAVPSEFAVGTSFQIKRTIYTIKSINKSAPKYKYNVVTQTGATWRASHEMLARGVRI